MEPREASRCRLAERLIHSTLARAGVRLREPRFRVPGAAQR
jgi:hypothetical protein